MLQGIANLSDDDSDGDNVEKLLTMDGTYVCTCIVNNLKIVVVAFYMYMQCINKDNFSLYWYQYNC